MGGPALPAAIREHSFSVGVDGDVETVISVIVPQPPGSFHYVPRGLSRIKKASIDSWFAASAICIGGKLSLSVGYSTCSLGCIP
jgi:hypothetical protein